MTELLVGTNKGLCVLRGSRGARMQLAGRKFEGLVCEYAMRDSRTGTYYASVTHGQYGPHLYFTDDPLGEWEEAKGPAFPEDTGSKVQRTWVIQPGEADGQLFAGVAPAALFESHDAGRTWELNRALWDQPSRPEWPPGAGGLCLHSIATWPGQPDRLAIGISAVGVWLTEDGGKSWRNSSDGLIPTDKWPFDWQSNKGAWSEIFEGVLYADQEKDVPSWFADDYKKFYPQYKDYDALKSVDWDYYAAHQKEWQDAEQKGLA